MDPEEAQRRLREDAVVLALDVPQRTEFGLDYKSWQTGARFRGVKMVPPGLHFIYCGAANTNSPVGETGPRSGIFRFLRAGEVLMLRYKADDECLADQHASLEDQERVRADLFNLDRELAPYPFDDSLKKWLALTNHISEHTLKRCQPSSGIITSVTEMEGHSGVMGQRGEDRANVSAKTAQAVQDWDKIKPVEAMRLQMREIPKRLAPPGATPAEVSQHNIDRSYTLDEILRLNCGGAYGELLGELQFSFVCFLIAHVYDGFEHWKQLVHILCNCDEALHKHSKLYIDLMGVLHFQMMETPSDFFVDIVSADNFLVHSLESFFNRVAEQEGLDARLKERVAKFKRHLTSHFKWEFDGSAEGDDPVIVETAPAAKESALSADDERLREAADSDERMEEATDGGTAPPAESSPSSFYTVFKY